MVIEHAWSKLDKQIAKIISHRFSANFKYVPLALNACGTHVPPSFFSPFSLNSLPSFLPSSEFDCVTSQLSEVEIMSNCVHFLTWWVTPRLKQRCPGEGVRERFLGLRSKRDLFKIHHGGFDIYHFSFLLKIVRAMISGIHNPLNN